MGCKEWNQTKTKLYFIGILAAYDFNFISPWRKNFDLTNTPDQVGRSDIEIVQISIFIFELHVSTKIADRLLIMICKIPKLN